MRHWNPTDRTRTPFGKQLSTLSNFLHTTMKMGALKLFETAVNAYQTTLYQRPEDNSMKQLSNLEKGVSCSYLSQCR